MPEQAGVRLGGRGFKVNEGPAVLVHGDKLFISYSRSATDEKLRKGCSGSTGRPIRCSRQTGIKPRSRCSGPAMKTASMARAIIVLPKRRRGEDVLVITRGITEIEGDRCMTPIVIRG